MFWCLVFDSILRYRTRDRVLSSIYSNVIIIVIKVVIPLRWLLLFLLCRILGMVVVDLRVMLILMMKSIRILLAV